MPKQEELRTRLRTALDAALADVELDPEDDPNELAQRIASLVRGVPQRLHDALGPFYDIATVSKFMDTTPENIAEHVHGGVMLGMLTDAGALIFPSFGFEGESAAEWASLVVGALHRSGVDGWTMGLWLVEPNTDLGGKTPLEWFNARGDIEVVERLAQNRGVHWSA